MVESAVCDLKTDDPSAILPDPSLLQRRTNRARQATRPQHPMTSRRRPHTRGLSGSRCRRRLQTSHSCHDRPAKTPGQSGALVRRRDVCRSSQESWTTVLGCGFHWAQAVERQFGEHGLIAAYKDKSGPLRDLLCKLIALPYLPAEEIPTAFNRLEDIAIGFHVARFWCLEHRELVCLQENGADKQRHWGLAPTAEQQDIRQCAAVPSHCHPARGHAGEGASSASARTETLPVSEERLHDHSRHCKQGRWQLGKNSRTAFWAQSSCCVASASGAAHEHTGDIMYWLYDWW